MLGRQEIERAGLGEVLRHITAAVMIVKAPSGESILDNRQSRQMSERYLGHSEVMGLEDLRALHDSGVFELVRPDGQPYEFEEWPVVRAIKSGQEVRDEELLQRMADGTQLWLRCNSSPIYDDEGRIVAGVVVVYDITEQKRAEEEHRESNRRTEVILESTTDAFFTLDREWRFTYINERGLRQLQGNGEELTREEVLGKNAWELYPELVGSVFYQKYHEAMREQKAVEFEANAPLSERWYEVHAYPSEEGLALYRRDITERKRAEEALRESSRRTENVLESITDAFWAVDRKWRFTYVNERTVQIFSELKDREFTREELVGQSVWEAFPNIVGTLAEEKYRQAVAEQQPAVFEYHYPGEGVVEGEESPWFEIHLYPSEEGLSVYYQDITERKRAQEEIETRHHQQAVVAELGLRALSESNLQSLMGEAVALVARTLEVEYSKIVDLLPGGEEMLLRAGMGWREGLVGNATEESGLDSQAGYTLVSEEPVFVEDQSTETRFSPSWLLREHGVVSSLTVVIHGQDEPFGVLGVHTTSRRTFSEDDANFVQAVANVLVMAIERKEAEKRLNEVREVERSRIARDLHDEALRNLTYALVEAQHVHSLSKDPQQADRMGRLVAALDRIGPQLRGAIYDLRLEGEEDKPFYELLESLVELQRTIAPDCEISLDVGDGLLSDPLGERGRELLRIIGEMLTNARRHSGAQNVWVAVWTSEDEKLCAEVSDDGRGFDSSEEPSATITTGGGMGIKGMRERARALGGELEIKSEPGKGTKVRFELVLKKDRQEDPKEEEPEKVHILLVEDHATVREAIASAFEREAGFEVVGQAVSLAEARQMLEEAEPVDVAVVDLGLPDGYGGDLIKDLRAAHSQAQALVLSASLDRTEIAGAVERGAAGILNKTSHLDEVVEAVRRLRAGETLIPLEEVVDLLRFAGSRREEEHEARQVIARLTPREREVLRALAEGLSSEGIAERLNISVRTQRNHMTNILAKLGVHSQLQALVFALRHGVVEIP